MPPRPMRTLACTPVSHVTAVIPFPPPALWLWRRSRRQGRPCRGRGRQGLWSFAHAYGPGPGHGGRRCRQGLRRPTPRNDAGVRKAASDAGCRGRLPRLWGCGSTG